MQSKLLDSLKSFCDDLRHEAGDGDSTLTATDLVKRYGDFCARNGDQYSKLPLDVRLATTSSVAQHLKYIYSVSDLSAVESAINELKDVLLSEDENERAMTCLSLAWISQLLDTRSPHLHAQLLVVCKNVHAVVLNSSTSPLSICSAAVALSWITECWAWALVESSTDKTSPSFVYTVVRSLVYILEHSKKTCDSNDELTFIMTTSMSLRRILTLPSGGRLMWQTLPSPMQTDVLNSVSNILESTVAVLDESIDPRSITWCASMLELLVTEPVLAVLSVDDMSMINVIRKRIMTTCLAVMSYRGSTIVPVVLHKASVDVVLGVCYHDNSGDQLSSKISSVLMSQHENGPPALNHVAYREEAYRILSRPFATVTESDVKHVYARIVAELYNAFS